ncbi:PIN domain-containing protein [Mucilaginibacter sp. UC70_90]
MSDFDVFIRNSVYPDAKSIFSATIRSISDIKDECLFIIDTNALLLPYYASSQDLVQIKEILMTLITGKRLYIPGQVAREFAANRPDRIKEVFQVLNQQINVIKEFKNLRYPLLNGTSEYNELTELEKDFNESTRKFREVYKKKLSQVLGKIKDWTWNDPVSMIYKELFTSEVIFDYEFDREFVKKELQRRYTHKLPPGYKDQAKADEGIGDLLIWYSILELGKKFKKHVIFISGEEKSDWLYKSEGQILYPRFELISEYMTASEGQSFHLIKFSEFLELMAGEKKMINDIVKIEKELEISDVLKDLDISDKSSNSDASQFTISQFSLKTEIDRELSQIQKIVNSFIAERTKGDFKLQDRFIDNLTMIHREGVIDYYDYKQLMSFFTKKDWHLLSPDEWYKLNQQLVNVKANVELSILLATL